jgi:hypothetical protein
MRDDTLPATSFEDERRRQPADDELRRRASTISAEPQCEGRRFTVGIVGATWYVP